VFVSFHYLSSFNNAFSHRFVVYYNNISGFFWFFVDFNKTSSAVYTGISCLLSSFDRHRINDFLYFLRISCTKMQGAARRHFYARKKQWETHHCFYNFTHLTYAHVGTGEN